MRRRVLVKAQHRASFSAPDTRGGERVTSSREISDAERGDDAGVEGAPRQGVEPRRDVGLDTAGGDGGAGGP